MDDDSKFRIKNFVSSAIELLEVNATKRHLSGLIFLLPLVLRLFEGLGRSESFVKKCEKGLNDIPGAKDNFLCNYIEPIFPRDCVVNAFAEYYAYLNHSTIELLITAYKHVPQVEKVVKTLPLLHYLKTETEEFRRGLLAWAKDLAEPILSAIRTFSIEELVLHIKNEADTDKFMKAFNDEDYGQCKETFSVGPQYWSKIPKLRAKWSDGLD